MLLPRRAPELDLEKALDFGDAPSGIHTRPKLLPLG